MKKYISRLFCGAILFTMVMGSVVACSKGNEENKAKESKYNAARCLKAGITRGLTLRLKA